MPPDGVYLVVEEEREQVEHVGRVPGEFHPGLDRDRANVAERLPRPDVLAEALELLGEPERVVDDEVDLRRLACLDHLRRFLEARSDRFLTEDRAHPAVDGVEDVVVVEHRGGTDGDEVQLHGGQHRLVVGVPVLDRDVPGVAKGREIVERGTLGAVFDETVHPYTEGLLGSVPSLDYASARLEPIGGNVPSLIDSEMGDRCYFVNRCPNAMEQCYEKPPEYDVGDEHAVKCYLAEEQTATTERGEADD